MTTMRDLIRIVESGGGIVPDMPYPFLYHATRKANLPSIRQNGLLTRHYGAVHGGMDIHPPKPAIYLARGRSSNNLHTSLFDGTPLVVLKIDATKLDPNEMWPDDAIYTAFANEEVFTTARQVAQAFGLDLPQAKELLERLENASEDELPLLLKPCWRWYLSWKRGGEVAYTADIPPSAIVGVRDLSPKN